MNASIDDFSKLEIKIGKIISAEKVEGTDKLIRMEVDFGGFKRQILSSIAQDYKAEDLVGKQCPFLVNLEPRVFKGLESQGMILAVEIEGKAILLHPDQVVPAGSVVK